MPTRAARPFAERARRLALGAALGARVAAGAAEPAMTTSAHAEVADGTTVLSVDFGWSSARDLQVRYRVENRGREPVMVFDRGDSVAVATHRLPLGGVPAPATEQRDGTLTLSHRALALPKRAPTVPPVPLAVRVDAGGRADGTFRTGVPSEVTRVRYCVGVAPFAEADFSAPQSAAGGSIWRASFALAERQRMLCTPWFDLARGAFERD